MAGTKCLGKFNLKKKAFVTKGSVGQNIYIYIVQSHIENAGLNICSSSPKGVRNTTYELYACIIYTVHIQYSIYVYNYIHVTCLYI